MKKKVVIGIIVGIFVLALAGYFVFDKENTAVIESFDWENDGVSLAIIKETGKYACFGCNFGSESSPALCKDPVLDAIEFLDEKEERYCDNDFEVIERGEHDDGQGASLGMPVSGKEDVDEIVVENDFLNCPENLEFQTPVDLSKVTSILYPGQVRGGDYKPHGGFRFDDSNNKISVKIPIDSYLVSASRYIENGKIQYLVEFNTDCNVKYRFDHLFVLSPKLQAIADTLPEAKPDDSRTTQINNIEFSKGQEIATEIGVPGNVFIDFGIYDYRKENEASKTSELISFYTSDLAKHAVCWFYWLPSEDAQIVKGFPATAGDSSSEYC